MNAQILEELEIFLNLYYYIIFKKYYDKNLLIYILLSLYSFEIKCNNQVYYYFFNKYKRFLLSCKIFIFLNIIKFFL